METPEKNRDDKLFEVEEILNHKRLPNGKLTYYVKWKVCIFFNSNQFKFTFIIDIGYTVEITTTHIFDEILNYH